MLFVVEDKEFCPHIFSKKVVDEFNALGHKSQSVYLGSTFWSRLFRTISKRFLSPFSKLLCISHLLFLGCFKFRKGDVVLVYESNGLQSFLFLRNFFYKISQKKSFQVFSIIQDGWMFTKNKLQNTTCKLILSKSDIVFGVTPYLVEALSSMNGKNNVKLLEEPIDVYSFNPNFNNINNNLKTIVWSGPPWKVIDEFKKIGPILEDVFLVNKFKLKIVTGSKRPKLDINISYEWVPFVGTSYKDQFKDADIALAYYEDSNYGKCKGNYKIKTYMAAGCAVVTSPVGYNNVLINEGETGFFASTDEEWVQKLLFLLQNDDVCLKVRKNAYYFVCENYSYVALYNKYLKIIKNL